MNHKRVCRGERGAAAVEMALVLPVLLFVLMGLIDFGRAYNAQLQLSLAAREGARLASIGTYTSGQITDRVQRSAPNLVGAAQPTWSITSGGCPGSGHVTVTVTSQFSWITGISAMSALFGPAFATPNQLRSSGDMQCAS